ERHGPQPAPADLRAVLVGVRAAVGCEIVAVGGNEVKDVRPARIPRAVLGSQKGGALVRRRKGNALALAFADKRFCEPDVRVPILGLNAGDEQAEDAAVRETSFLNRRPLALLGTYVHIGLVRAAIG